MTAPPPLTQGPVIFYEVLLTTRISETEYGAAINITKDVDIQDLIFQNGLGSLQQEIDNGDYDVGIFVYGNLKMKVVNYDAKFNPETDWRSYFIFSRDLAKVEIKYHDTAGNTRTIFKGLINEEGSRSDFINDTVEFVVLSQDSVLRKVNVIGGTIDNGNTIQQAIQAIINKPQITAILNYDAALINPSLNITIDDAAPLDNLTVKDALDKLLIASNSFLYIDEDDFMVVRSRDENNNIPYEFWNDGDFFQRENIIMIKNWNTGLQRVINTANINDVQRRRDDYIRKYTVKAKDVDLEFITDASKMAAIGDAMIDEFKQPKEEFELETDVELARDIKLLDVVSVSFTNRIRKCPDAHRMPIYDVAKYDCSPPDLYPYSFGTFEIRAEEAYKVIGITEIPEKLRIILKLRKVGKEVDDGVFSYRLAEDERIRLLEDGRTRVIN